jgi:amidase
MPAARIGERNPELNALVDLHMEQALDEAAAGGGGDGPLAGVPVSVKHNFDVAGMPTTLGIRSRAGLVADQDELAVRRLREAGAIVLGKANMPDLAIRWNTLSSLHGPTRNPRDPERSAGGSSGGDAAAVGAGMAALGLGSDYEETRELFDRMRGVLWVNLLGLPAVALGNGVQIVARRFHDRDALRAAQAIETRGGGE